MCVANKTFRKFQSQKRFKMYVCCDYMRSLLSAVVEGLSQQLNIVLCTSFNWTWIGLSTGQILATHIEEHLCLLS